MFKRLALDVQKSAGRSVRTSLSLRVSHLLTATRHVLLSATSFAAASGCVDEVSPLQKVKDW